MSNNKVTNIKTNNNGIGEKFIEAMRLKIRIDDKSVEDLWFCTIDELRKIYQDLHNQKKSNKKEDVVMFEFDNKQFDEDNDNIDLKIEIVNYIAKTKNDEYNKNEEKVKYELEIKELEELITKKKKEEQLNMSLEELENRLKELNSNNN